jgi:hypothetical protein
MKGIILDYFEEKNGGYISGDDNNRYQFNIEDWKTLDTQPTKGLNVKFNIDGNKATDVYLSVFDLDSDVRDNTNENKRNYLEIFRDNKLVKRILVISGISIVCLAGISFTLGWLRDKQLKNIEQANQTIESIIVDQLPENMGEIKQSKIKIEEALKLVTNIPNYPTSAYAQAQETKQIIEEKLKLIKEKEQRLLAQEKEAKDGLILATKAANDAVKISENPPHSVAVWEQAKAKWEEAINHLKSAPTNASIAKEIEEKLESYQASLYIINQRIVDEKRAESSFNLALISASKAFSLTKNNPKNIDIWKQSSDEWQGAISILKEVPGSTTFYKEAINKIPEYQKNLAAVNQKIKQRELAVKQHQQKVESEQELDSFIKSYMDTITSYSYTPGIEDAQYWCSSSLQNQSVFSSNIYKYAILWKKIQPSTAVYQIRLETSEGLLTYSFHLKKTNDKWCLTEIK